MAAKAAKKEQAKGPATIRNRRASFDYEFLATYEAGIALVGCEVKSVFLGRANLTDAYCQVKGGELWLISLDIEPYSHSVHFIPERRRDRKLLMHRKEIDLIHRRSQEKGLAIIPVRLYFGHGKVKVEIALARGKKEHDKRDSIQEKDARRELRRPDADKY
jgi:SsrA-binding protein